MLTNTFGHLELLNRITLEHVFNMKGSIVSNTERIALILISFSMSVYGINMMDALIELQDLNWTFMYKQLTVIIIHTIFFLKRRLNLYTYLLSSQMLQNSYEYICLKYNNSLGWFFKFYILKLELYRSKEIFLK